MLTKKKPLKSSYTLICLLILLINSVQTQQSSYEKIHNTIFSTLIDESPLKDSLKKETITFNEDQNQQIDNQQQNLLIDQNQNENQKNENLLPMENPTQQQIQSESIQQHSHYHKPSEPQFWYNLLLVVVLTVIGAFCSGIGVGFCNIDKLQLQVMTMSKDPHQQKVAKTIHQVIKNHHLWLTTILVYNAIALESLPLVAHTLMPDWLAIIFSTIIVLIGAQIVPQAICTGPKKMVIAYYCAPIITIMRKMLFFIIHPIAKGLDHLMGVHNHQRIQHKDFASYLTGNKILKQTQKMLLTSTLQLRCQRVMDKMVPIKKLYMLECSEVITKEKVDQMLKSDFSHVIVYRETKDTIAGIIKLKEFALHYLKSKGKKLKAQEFIGNRTSILTVYKDTNILEMLMLFQANSRRIAFVCDEKRKTALDIPSIMYTKNDMIINKKGAKIIGAIFMHQIFDQITYLQDTVPQQISAQNAEETEMKELKGGLNEPLIEKH